MPKHILVVDDEPLIQDLLAKALKSLEYDCTLAAHGLEAIAAIEGGLLPDLIIMDIIMPMMNGTECIDWIRRQPKPICSVPIIALSAAHNLGGLEAMHANHVLVKPFEISVLDAVIAHSLNRKDLQESKDYVDYRGQYRFSCN